MLKGLLKLAVAAAGGYSLSRAIEARSQGVPLIVAFSLDNGIKGLLTPVSQLPRTLPTGPTVIDVTPS